MTRRMDTANRWSPYPTAPLQKFARMRVTSAAVCRWLAATAALATAGSSKKGSDQTPDWALKGKPMSIRHVTALFPLLLLTAAAPAQMPVSTAFTYQGQLKDGGNPASGS